MKHDGELHTLTGAYALHSLTPAEHEVFSAHLTDCPSCRQEVAEFSATAARLGAAAALPPPPRMKDEVLYGIDSVRQLPPLLPAAGKPMTFTAILRRKAITLTIAAGIAGVAVLGGATLWQNQRADEARQQAETSERRLQDLTAVMAAPDVRTVHGRTTGGATTSVVSSRLQNRAVFIGTGLPDPGEGRTYQLWFDDHGTMRPAGLLTREGATLMQGGIRGASGVGLTVEPAGGSAQPTSRPLMLLALPA
ncbi:anti-sigma factor [Streptomyces sp. NBC_01443]|uniref:anti-sigma factor n=1 Tax=Streptomyces sp. NBC_01443 TaxID=2903868 RepID=UPI00224EB02E|nr:anti-sigma factor [Streptomyces sp. NBC_01443]MCX4625713.1 anti-sigma factor [Streptomyces sp. NBC_01443]